MGLGPPILMAVEAFEAVVRRVAENIEERASVLTFLVAIHAGGAVDLLELLGLPEPDRRPREGRESEGHGEDPRGGVGRDAKAPDHGSHRHAPATPTATFPDSEGSSRA